MKKGASAPARAPFHSALHYVECKAALNHMGFRALP